MHVSSVISAPATGERITVSSLYTFLNLSHVAGTGHYHLGPLPTSTRETCLAVTYTNTRRNAIDNPHPRRRNQTRVQDSNKIISIRKDERQLISVVTSRLERYTTTTACRGLARTPSQTDLSNYDDAAFTPRLMITICFVHSPCIFIIRPSYRTSPFMDNPCISFLFG